MAESNFPIEEETISTLVSEQFTLSERALDTNSLTALLVHLIVDSTDADVRIVSLIGGAASGKSTLSRGIVEQLVAQGLKADVIGTDDFVVGDREYRRTHFEGKEPRAKYDFGLLNSKVEAIKNNRTANETIGVPTYDQHSGKAIEVGEDNFIHQIGRVDVLIVEGDFSEVEEPDISIFLDVPASERLKNRIARDVVHRNETDTEKVIANFALRQETQHLPYTLPAVEGAQLLVRTTVADKQWQYDVYLHNIEQ